MPTRNHLQVLVPNRLISEASSRGMMSFELPAMQVPEVKYDGVRVVAIAYRPERDAIVAVLEHPSYPATQELDEAPLLMSLDALPDVKSIPADDEPATGGEPADTEVPTPPVPDAE